MLAFLLVVAAIFLSRPLYDPDFYGHLKAGEQIWKHKALPAADPFGVPPLPEPTPQTAFTLTSYWLFQLVLYAFFSAAGMSGIIILRWMLAGVVLLICMRWSNLRNTYVLAALAFCSLELLEHFFFERPQFFSFIAFGLLLAVLFRFTQQTRPWHVLELLAPLSLLMLVWANMHGAYLAGIGVLVLFCALEGIKFLHPALAPLSPRNYRILLVSSAAALTASWISPHAFPGVGVIGQFAFGDSHAAVLNREYLSLIDFLRLGYDYVPLFYLVSMVLTAAALLTSRLRTNLTWVLVLAITGFFAFRHFRHVPFFLIASTLFLMHYCEKERGGAAMGKTLLVLVALIFLYGVRDELPRLREVGRHGWVPASVYPVGAADFLASRGAPGDNIVSLDYWGSYLLWRLGPEQKIFEDSRHLNPGRTAELFAVYGEPGGGNGAPAAWKDLFRHYRITFAVLPVLDEQGRTPPLTRAMIHESGWKMLYADGTAAVFKSMP